MLLEKAVAKFSFPNKELKKLTWIMTSGWVTAYVLGFLWIKFIDTLRWNWLAFLIIAAALSFYSWFIAIKVSMIRLGYPSRSTAKILGIFGLLPFICIGWASYLVPLIWLFGMMAQRDIAFWPELIGFSCIVFFSFITIRKFLLLDYEEHQGSPKSPYVYFT